MSHQLLSSCCALVVLGACSLLPGTPARTAVAVETAETPADAGAPGDASAGAAPAEAALQGPAERRRQDEAVFAFWRDPEFQRRFAESYLRVSDIEPTATASEVELMNEVRQLMAEQEFDKAISRLRGRQSESASAVIDHTLAGLYFQRDQLEQAEPLEALAVQKAPRFRRAWQSLGFMRMRLGRHAAAADAFVRVIELGGVDAMTYGLLAYANVAAGDFIAAESAYRMAAMLEPARVEWREGLVRAFSEQQRYPEAAALCGVLLEKHPERTDLWMNQAKAFLKMNEVAKAAENLEILDRLGHSTSEGLALLGDIYVNQSLCEPASKAYLRAIAMPDKVGLDRVMRAARQIAARGAYAECQALVDGIGQSYAAELDPAAQKALLKLRAQIAVATGAGEEQAKILLEIVDLDPLDGNSLMLLGRYYTRTDDPDRAMLYYQRAAEIEEFAADAKVQHAQVLAKLGRFGEAVPLLRAAQKLNERPQVQKLLEDVERAAGGGRR